jgi:hypothetical protein
VAEKIATWGYSKTDDKIFDLEPGEKLPEGYFGHPAMIKGSAADKKMLEDAAKEGLTGHQFQQFQQVAPPPKLVMPTKKEQTRA